MVENRTPLRGPRFQKHALTFINLILLFSCSVVSDSLWPHGLQAPLSTTVSWSCSDSCALSRWCYLTTSFSVTLFFCLQSFPAAGSFPMTWLFASLSQGIGASASVPPMSIQGWFPLGLTGLISLQSKGLSIVFSKNTVRKHQYFSAQPSLQSSPYMTTGKTIALTRQTSVWSLHLPF